MRLLGLEQLAGAVKFFPAGLQRGITLEGRDARDAAQRNRRDVLRDRRLLERAFNPSRCAQAMSSTVRPAPVSR